MTVLARASKISSNRPTYLKPKDVDDILNINVGDYMAWNPRRLVLFMTTIIENLKFSRRGLTPR
jgi:hypothetical protein